MKILITGASGRLGNKVYDALHIEHEIITLSRSTRNDSQNHYAIDLSSNVDKSLDELFKKERPDSVIHLAAMLGSDCERDPETALALNVHATKRLATLANANGVSSFIFSSSAAVYKQTMVSPTAETENVSPQSVYGKTKLQAESLLTNIASTGSTTFTSLRTFNIYGETFNDSLVNKLMNSDKANIVKLFGYKNYLRDYIHVNDVVQALRLVLGVKSASAHTIYNIASGKATSNQQLIESLRRRGYLALYEAPSEDEVNVSWANIAKAVTDLGFSPQTEII